MRFYNAYAIRSYELARKYGTALDKHSETYRVGDSLVSVTLDEALLA